MSSVNARFQAYTSTLKSVQNVSTFGVWGVKRRKYRSGRFEYNRTCTWQDTHRWRKSMRRKRDVVLSKWALRAAGIQLSTQNRQPMAVVGYQRSSDRPFSLRVISTGSQTRTLGTSSYSDFWRKTELPGGPQKNILGRYDISCGHRITSHSIDGTDVFFLSCSKSDSHLPTTFEVSRQEPPP
jgi:hypothetical protein